MELRRSLAVLLLTVLVLPAGAHAVSLDAYRLQQWILTSCGVTLDGVTIGTQGVAASVKVFPASSQPASQPCINSFDWSPSAAQNFQNTQNKSGITTTLPSGSNGQLAFTWRMIAKLAVDQLNILRAAYPLAVSSITRSGTVATATTLGAHGLTNGQQVTVWGAPQTAYNGVQTITVTGATTFTYTVAGSPVTPATPGALIVYPVNANFNPLTMTQAINAMINAINSGAAD